MEIRGPFLDLQKAARHCGYAKGTFERILREFDLPKCGPKKNRFAVSVLDAFMSSPDTFKKAQPQRAPRRHVPQPLVVR